MRLSVITGAVVAFLLVLPVAYSSYWVPTSGDDLGVSLVVRDLVGTPNVSLPGVLGVSVDWVDNAHGLYNPVTGLFNPAPVSELIGLEPQYLRFPAGHLSQVYNWTLGVGNNDERGKNPTGGPKPQESLFGTDEFFKLVDHTGSSGVMVVNANDGTPQMARDWVSYCNDPPYRGLGRERAANGYPVAYDITDWEIGYEPYLPKYWDGTTGEDGAGTEYAKMVKEYSRAMKTTDPSIKVGAWLVLDPNEELVSADSRWNADFLDEIAGQKLIIDNKTYDYYDYVVVKVNMPGIESLLDYEDLFQYSYAKVAKTFSENLRELRQLIDRLDVRSGGVPIAFGFYGPYFGDSGWNTQAPSDAGTALITADLSMQILDIALKDGVRLVKYACYSQLNTLDHSALMINPEFEMAHIDTWQRSPSYYAFQLCGQLQGGKPLSVTSLKGVTFDLPAERELDSYKDVPYVSAIGTMDLDSSTIHLLIINRDLERSVDCRLNFDVAGLSGPLQLQRRIIIFDSVLADNLAGENVRSPLPVSTQAKVFTPPDVTISIPNAGVVLVTIRPEEVS